MSHLSLCTHPLIHGPPQSRGRVIFGERVSGVGTPAEGSGNLGAGRTDGESSKRDIKRGFREASEQTLPPLLCWLATCSLRLTLERAGGGHWGEAESFLPRTFGEHSAPAPSCSESTPSAQWPQLCGGRDLLCELQRAGLIRPGPSPRLSAAARAHPRTRQRKDTSCLPACWHQKGQGSSEPPAGSQIRALATNPVGK